jgi:hypothetical protein
VSPGLRRDLNKNDALVTTPERLSTIAQTGSPSSAPETDERSAAVRMRLTWNWRQREGAQEVGEQQQHPPHVGRCDHAGQ